MEQRLSEIVKVRVLVCEKDVARKCAETVIMDDEFKCPMSTFVLFLQGLLAVYGFHAYTVDYSVETVKFEQHESETQQAGASEPSA